MKDIKRDFAKRILDTTEITVLEIGKEAVK